MLGTIGEEERMEATVVSDTVNVASRLEGLTKEVGYHLVCSHAVVDRLENRDGLVPLGARPIKGHSALEVFGYDRITPAAAPR